MGTDDDDRRYRRTTTTLWEWESKNDGGNDNKPVRNREDHPPATSLAQQLQRSNPDFGQIVPAAKKRPTHPNLGIIILSH